MKTITFLLTLLLFFFTSCSNEQKIQPSGKSVTIVVLAPLSGKDKRFGTQSMLGLQGAKKIKPYLPNGDEIVFDVIDTQSDLHIATTKLQHKLNKGDVVAIISFMGSTNMVAMKEILKKYKIPTIATIATNNAVTQKDGYVTQVCMNNHNQSLVASHYIRDEKLLRHVGVFFESTNRYSTELATEFKETFSTIGGEVDFFIDLATQEGKEELKTLQKNNTEMVFSTTNAKLATQIINHMKEQKWEIDFLGGDGLFNDALKETPHQLKLFEGIYVIEHYAYNASPTKQRKQLESYLEKQDAKESTYAFLAYDGYALLTKTLQTCTNYDQKCINPLLQNTTPIQGISGNFSIIQAKAKRDIFINKIHNLKLLKEVVIY
jgi:branched-chain amino acid transport system substrate-binding protein